MQHVFEHACILYKPLPQFTKYCMDFEYTGSVAAKTKGCAIISVILRYPSRYLAGDSAYTLFSAEQGKLEKVWVRRGVIADFTGLLPVWNYLDTTNRLWQERELLSLDEATVVINNYKARMALLASKVPCP